MGLILVLIIVVAVLGGGAYYANNQSLVFRPLIPMVETASTSSTTPTPSTNSDTNVSVIPASGTSAVTGAAPCSTYESKPVITSITPASGPIGTTIEIQGCNFLGFESDKEIWFTNSRGEKGFLNGQMDAATRASNIIARVTLQQKLCQINSYSGLDCPVLELAPGAYTVYSNSYGGNSNVVNFTVTAQSKACTQEAKLCPDGSYVGRTGPNCEFAACSQ